MLEWPASSYLAFCRDICNTSDSFRDFYHFACMCIVMMMMMIRHMFCGGSMLSNLDRHPFSGLFSRTTLDKPAPEKWILMNQEMIGWQWH